MIVKPFVRSPYNYDMQEAGDEDAVECLDGTRAQQSFAEECDINTIVRRFGITGMVPAGLVTPEFAHYDGVFDFQTAMNAVVAAREDFMQLPGELRARFMNDPQAFLEFCSDPKNKDEMVKLGLANAPAAPAAPPEPIAVRVIAEEPKAG